MRPFDFGAQLVKQAASPALAAPGALLPPIKPAVNPLAMLGQQHGATTPGLSPSPAPAALPGRPTAFKPQPKPAVTPQLGAAAKPAPAAAARPAAPKPTGAGGMAATGAPTGQVTSKPATPPQAPSMVNTGQAKMSAAFKFGGQVAQKFNAGSRVQTLQTQHASGKSMQGAVHRMG